MSQKMNKKARKAFQAFLDDDKQSQLTKVLHELGKMPFWERAKNAWMILRGGPPARKGK